MKPFLLYLISCIAFCCKESNTSITANSSWDKISKKHQAYIDTNSLSFIYINHGGGDMPESYSKIFTIKNGECQKIEFKKVKNEIDSLYNAKEVHYIKRETVLSRFCTHEEAKIFLNKIEGLKIYEIPEEAELIKKCEEKDSLYKNTKYIDAGSITIHVVSGRKVRSLNYNHPHLQINHCNSVEDWKVINKIIELFEEEWFSEEHFKK